MPHFHTAHRQPSPGAHVSTSINLISNCSVTLVLLICWLRFGPAPKQFSSFYRLSHGPVAWKPPCARSPRSIEFELPKKTAPRCVSKWWECSQHPPTVTFVPTFTTQSALQKAIVGGCSTFRAHGMGRHSFGQTRALGQISRGLLRLGSHAEQSRSMEAERLERQVMTSFSCERQSRYIW